MTVFNPAQPFILLDDAHAEGGSILFSDPQELIIARRPSEVSGAFETIAKLASSGHHLAGYVAYEAGLALEPRLAPLAPARCGADGPLLWFGAFARHESLTPEDFTLWLASHAHHHGQTSIGPLSPAVSPGGYAASFARLKEAIRAGDIYQVNFTLPLVGRWCGDPLALYANLRARGGGSHGGLVFDGTHWLLSLSPELFFNVDNGHITARPMKGTRPRGTDPQDDAACIADLAASSKDRAENLMIVDLLRNDLARMAIPGSVKVKNPFTIETYPTVHQMVSTVRATLRAPLGATDLLAAIFPCGSITGAPKIRAMEWINATEQHTRGAYCGAIGYIAPGHADGSGKASFNVAIRTLRLSPDEAPDKTDNPGMAASYGGQAVLGVGSAIVADSECLPEWRECLIKGSFVNQPMRNCQTEGDDANVAQFDLIETMLFTPDEGVPLLELHLERLRASAEALGFSCDRHRLRNAIQALCFDAEAPSKLRLMLARSGAMSLEISDLPAALDTTSPVICAVLPLPFDERDWRLAHKTSDRALYEAGLKAARGAGAGECLFIRDDRLVTEGSFTTIFIERDGALLTPPAQLGLLPGVLRRSLLDKGRAREAALTLDDLAGGFLIGNALRGLMRATLLA